jgi:hypothetical protein
MAKKRMKQMENVGFYDTSNQDMFADVHFFDNSSGIDPEVLGLLN